MSIEISEITETAKLEMKFFNFPCDIKPLKIFKDICCNMWQYAWLVIPMKSLWNGFMKASHYVRHPSKTAIHFEPVIDMPSIDYSCIYSTMSFVSDMARKYGYDPVLTFDQPLYWKAMEITTHEHNKKVLSINWSLCLVPFIHV